MAKSAHERQGGGWGDAVLTLSDSAIEEYLPPAKGNRNKWVFKLAQHLKGMAPDASRDSLQAIVKRWHQLALERELIATAAFAETWGDFGHAWRGVTFPKGAVLNELLDGVEDDPVPAGTPADYLEDGGQVLLVKICARLQCRSGDKPFYLSCRKAGELTGLHFTNARHRLNGMWADGLLERVKAGTRKEATEWRFLL